MERAQRKRRTVIALGMLLACCACAFGLDPSLDISQYAHTAWRVRDGFFKGYISSIAQTPDGYLWLGTEFGLLRFDGVRAVPWKPPAGEHLPNDNNFVRALLAARDGTLWIGTFQGLASWKDGKLTPYADLAGRDVAGLLEDREGTVWVGASYPTGRLCAIRSGNTQCYGDDGRFGHYMGALYEDRAGNLWVGSQTGLWRWKPGPPKPYPVPKGTEVSGLTEDGRGTLLIAGQGGVKQLVDEKAEPYSLPGIERELEPDRLLRDRNGGLWIATHSRGLVHVHQGKTDEFAEADGLSGDTIDNLFEDREGNIWVATVNGLDRFRDFAVPTISRKQGLSSALMWSVLAGRDGSLWLGSADGLNRWKGGQVTIYRRQNGLADDSADSLFQDDLGRIWVSTLQGVAYLEGDRFVPVRAVPGGVVHSIAGDGAGNVWIGDQNQGLFHLRGGSVVERVPWAGLGHNNAAMTLLLDPVNGGLWLGFWSGGVAYFQNGQVRASYAASDGLGKGHVMGLRFDPDGTVWASTEGGLSRIKNGHVATLTSNNGLPCDTVHWMMEDDSHSVWLYMACGLVRIARPELDAWAADPKRPVHAAVFDSSDGVRSQAVASVYNPNVSKTADGKLWFSTWDGVSVIDPRHLPFNKLPPPVHIEKIVADDKTYEVANGMRLPAQVRNLTIDYTALSLVVPEKVHFRYKLEGQEKDWREVVNDREVQYTNLPPKHYKFRVIACNNSGVWNEEGAALDFVIPPAWYQTNWFRAACVAAFLALLWAAYQLRVRQLAYQFNMRLDERVAERTRVARDLHDTLLQSFQALLPLFQVGIKKLPEGAVDSRKTLQLALDRASDAIGEGRDAIKGLRMSTTEKNDLAMAIRTIGEEFAAGENGQNSISFQLLVEGTPLNLHPILRDEVYRLATEALRNSFRHADAKNVEVEIRYDEKYFRLRVRDDGKGIPSDVLSRDGREGHYGLPGMRERAKLVGGKLTIWTEMDSGTEIELVIPGARAYVKSARPFWYFGKRSATETDEKESIERE